MDEREIRSLFGSLQRQAPDAARLAELADGATNGARADDAELLRLARTPGAAAAYRIARDSRADALVLAQALEEQALAQSPVRLAQAPAGSARGARRPAWHYALAASVALFAVALVLAPQWRSGDEGIPAIADGPAAVDEVPPLFAGSFENGRGDGAGGEREIFHGGFDS